MGSGWMGFTPPNPAQVARMDRGIAKSRDALREMREHHRAFMEAHPEAELAVVLAALAQISRRTFCGKNMDLVLALAITMPNDEPEEEKQWN
jgi:hypothetical protein